MVIRSLLSILTIAVLLTACEDTPSSLLVLNENMTASAISNNGYDTLTVTGSYLIESYQNGHLIKINAPCGHFNFIFTKPNSLRYDALTSDTSSCNLHSQVADQQWIIVLKSVEGFTASPPKGWPDNFSAANK